MSTRTRTRTRTTRGARPADPKVALLRGLPSLAAVRGRDLAAVAPMVEDLEVPAGTVLVTEGATCHEVLLVLHGHGIVSVGGAPVGRVGPGDVVGDIAVRQGTPHETTVTADGPIHLLVAGPESYRAFVRHPVIVRAAAAGLSDRLRRADAATAPAKIAESLTNDPSSLVIPVKDSGIGMDRVPASFGAQMQA